MGFFLFAQGKHYAKAPERSIRGKAEVQEKEEGGFYQ
jgi:hypothetical protein